MGLDSIGLFCIDWLLWLGWVGLGWYVQPKPTQLQPTNLIKSKQTNAMQPNPMNPMMPSNQSQGNRNNPSSQHNQSYQSNQPVQASKAMTSIITNQSSQPTKSIKSIMQTINHSTQQITWDWIGGDWSHCVVWVCLGLDLLVLLNWVHGLGLGWFIVLDLIRCGYIGLCWTCFEWLWFDSQMCFISFA